MTDISRDSHDLLGRILAFVDATQADTVTPEQLAEFEQLLRQRPEAQSLYAEVITMSVCLPRAMTGIDHGRNGRNGKKAVPFPAVGPTDFPLEVGPDLDDGPIGLPGTDDPPGGTPLLFRPTPLSLFIASVVIGSLLIVLAVWTAPRFRGPARLQPDLLAPFVARVTKTVDCRWIDPDSPPMVGSFLRQGQLLKLEAGLVEIRLDEGARVILEGPGTMTVESAGSVGLERGKLVALVPDEATGFTVRTPHAVLRDLGTEFGVEVQPDGCTELCVFQGQVRVETSETPVEAGRVVKAGQAVRVATSLGTSVLETSAEPERFVRELPGSNDKVLASTFGDSLEGWTKKPLGKTSSLLQQTTGGNPGGCLLSIGNGPGTKLIAPPRYHGNLTRFDGGNIAFDAKYVEPGDNETRASGFDFGLITIAGAGRTAAQQIAASPPTDRWRTYRGSFTAAAFGVSSDEWKAILGDVTSLTVNLNAFRGVPNESLAFDNITLRGQGGDVSGPSAR